MDNLSFSGVVSYVQLNDILMRDSMDKYNKEVMLRQQGKRALSDEEMTQLMNKKEGYSNKKSYAMAQLQIFSSFYLIFDYF